MTGSTEARGEKEEEGRSDKLILVGVDLVFPRTGRNSLTWGSKVVMSTPCQAAQQAPEHVRDALQLKRERSPDVPESQRPSRLSGFTCWQTLSHSLPSGRARAGYGLTVMSRMRLHSSSAIYLLTGATIIALRLPVTKL